MNENRSVANFETITVTLLGIKENKINKPSKHSKKSEKQKIHHPPTFLKSFYLENITILNLSYCELSALPESSVNVNLKELILSHNNFQEIPSCIYAGLKKLEVLDLSHNEISLFDMEPDSIGQLKIVNLSNNKFKNIPKWFLMFRSVNLEELVYSTNNSFHYNYLKNSCNRYCNRVKKLEFTNCHLVDRVFPFFKCFKLLEFLDISNTDNGFINQFVEIDNLFIKTNWSQLQVLKINNLSLALFPEGIAWIESLIELHISNNNISWLPTGIQFLVYLEVLDISNNDLIGIPDEIKKLEALRILKAASNIIETVPDLKPMENLEVLDLYDNLLEDISFNISNIKYIDLEYNYLKTDEMECVDRYNKLKDNFRKNNFLNRVNGLKLERTCSSSSDEKLYHEYSYDQTNCFTNTFEDDSWDSTVVQPCITENHDIDSADENWDGELVCINLKEKSKFLQEKIYVEDENWMFEDAD